MDTTNYSLHLRNMHQVQQNLGSTATVKTLEKRLRTKVQGGKVTKNFFWNVGMQNGSVIV